MNLYFFTIFVQKNERNMTLVDIEHKMRIQNKSSSQYQVVDIGGTHLQPATASKFVFISITKQNLFLTQIIVQGSWLVDGILPCRCSKMTGSFHFIALMSPRAIRFSMKREERASSFWSRTTVPYLLELWKSKWDHIERRRILKGKIGHGEPMYEGLENV